MLAKFIVFIFFFFNDTATTEIYTLSLHDALPILQRAAGHRRTENHGTHSSAAARSEEHTSELQSLAYIVCRLLLEKKKQNFISRTSNKKTKDINANPAQFGKK